MKQLITILLVGLMVVLLEACNIGQLKPIEMVEKSDFSKEESFQYALDETKDLIAMINVCATRIELVNEDRDDIGITIYYDEQEKRDKINFSYRDISLEITKTDQRSDNCSRIKAFDSFITISLPYHMNNINIDINSYNVIGEFSDFVYHDFTYDHVNGNLTFNNSLANVLNVEIINGNIAIESIDAYRADIDTINGNVTLDGITIPRLDLNSTNGNIQIKNSEVSQEIHAKTVNGKIKLEDINQGANHQAEYTAESTNGAIRLHNVYGYEIDLETVNGDISYHNDDKDFVVHQVYYQKTNGSIDFDINGTITKK